MPRSRIETIPTRKLKEYLETRNERQFSLVDVRQPEEYAAEHIPGATLLPLPELEQRLHELPRNGEVIFYCRSGNRSMVAARLLADSGLGPSRVFNVAGGMTAWMGQRLEGYPRLDLLGLEGGSETETLKLILEMEKGAFHYYEAITRKLGDGRFAQLTAVLLELEQYHARTAYDLFAQRLEQVAPFEQLFQEATGTIIEGGEPSERLVERVRDLDGGRLVGLAELALEIELRAYDLYRNAADLTGQSDLLTLAEQEKAHIRLLSRTWTEEV